MNYREEFLKTMQPYFVLSTSCFYQEVIKNYGISHFYSYDIEEEEESVIVVPDGCVDIIFAYDKNEIKAKACGTVLEHSRLFREQKKSYFGVRFLPGVLPAILDVKKKELIDQQIELNEIVKTKKLEERILEADNFEQREKIFLEAYFGCLKENKESKNKQRLAAVVKRAIYNSDGDVKVRELEELTGYTGRYIDETLQEEVGLSTKTFSRIIKFQKILDRMSYDTTTKLSDVAADFGYYDQAHFIRSFRTGTSMTPKEYRNMILNKEYNTRVVNLVT